MKNIFSPNKRGTKDSSNYYTKENVYSIKESLEKKVFVLRYLDGKPNREATTAIRKAEGELSKHPEFVGLALRGSAARGYAREDSDIDVVILYDSSRNENRKSRKNADDNNRVKERFRSLAEEIYVKTHHRVNPRFQDINPKTLMPNERSDPDYYKLADIFLLVTGKKIDGYRKHWSNYFNELKKTEQKPKINAIVHALADEDVRGYDKMVERISGTSPDLYNSGSWRQQAQFKQGVPKYEDFKNIRYSLWKRRVRTLLKL